MVDGEVMSPGEMEDLVIRDAAVLIMESGAPDTDTYLGLTYHRLGNGRPRDLESQQGALCLVV